MIRPAPRIVLERPSFLAAWLAVFLSLAGSSAFGGPVGSAGSIAAIVTSMAAGFPGANDDLSPAYVPSGAGLVLTIRPAAILAEGDLGPAVQALRQQQESITRELGVAIDHIEQATFAYSEFSPRSRPTITLLVKEPGDALGVIKRHFGDSVEEQYAGRRYRKAADGSAGCMLLSAESRIVVIAESEAGLRALLDAEAAAGGAAQRPPGWNEISGMHAALILKTALVRDMLDQGVRGGFGIGAVALAVAPLWQNSTSITIGLKVDKRLSLSGKVTAPSGADAKKIADTLSSIATLGGNVTSGLRKQAVPDPTAQKIIEEVDSFLAGLSVERKETEVTVAGSARTEIVAGLVAMVVPDLVRNLVQARRIQSINNLKQIALALHNYHGTYGHLPPAVSYGPANNGNSKHGHSWRVAILPFIEQQALYTTYKFDEPWDSPDNKKILDQMPALFREPSDPPGSTSASYFAIVGPGTMFGDKEGVGFPKVRDGLSNTLMVVEAKRQIPWTKPEDISYVADKPLPELGGHHELGFLAAFGDGAVRFVALRIAEQTLRNLITRDDGNPIDAIPEP